MKSIKQEKDKMKKYKDILLTKEGIYLDTKSKSILISYTINDNDEIEIIEVKKIRRKMK
jgi:hypothetical protein